MTLLEMQQKRAHVSEELMKLSTDLTPENRSRYDELYKEADGLAGDIERRQKAETLDAEMRKTVTPPNEQIGAGEDDPYSKEARKAEKRAQRKKDAEERAAFRYWAQTGSNATGLLRLGEVIKATDVPKEIRHLFEKRDMGIAAPTAAVATSVLVPQGFMQDVDIALKAYGQLAANVTTLDTATGQPLPYPTANDTGVMAEYNGEGAQVGTADVPISNVLLGAWKVDTKLVKVSLELLQDSAFDIESFLKDQFGIRLARFLEQELVLGTGSANSHINGLLGASLAVQGNMAAGSSTNTGGSETGGVSIGSKDLINLVAQVDPMYRPTAKFVMHDATWQFLAQLLDKYGRPLFLPNPQSGKLESIYGYPIVYNQYMPQIAVNNKTVLYGNLKKYFLRRVMQLNVVRLVERFADYGQVAFIGFARYDGNLIDAGTHPVKYLYQAAS